MNKIKLIIITFSLILSMVLVNTIPVYAASDNDVQDTTGDKTLKDSFNYSIFNANIIPFYADLDTGIGWYYSGYMPEISFEDDSPLIESYNNGYAMGTWDHFYYSLKDSLEEKIVYYLQFNSYKTHWYYYDGNNLKLYPNSSGSAFNNSSKVELGAFLTGIDGKKYGYENLANAITNDNYCLTNFGLTENGSWREYNIRWSNGKLSYGIYLPWIYGFDSFQDGTNEQQEYILHGLFLSHFYNADGTLKNDPRYYHNKADSENKYENKIQYYKDWLEEHPNYQSGNMALTPISALYEDTDKNGTYTLDDSIILSYFGSTGSNVLKVENCELWLYFDIQKTGDVNQYERVYISKDDLVNKYGVRENEDGCNLTFKLRSILGSSSLYTAGEDDKISLLAVGMFWSYNKEQLTGNQHLLLSYNNYISNHSYLVFVYSYSNIISDTIRQYFNLTDYSSWTLKDTYLPKNEFGNTIYDGIDPDFFISQDSQDAITLISNLINSFFKSINSLLNKIVLYTEKLASLFSAFFSLIPEGIKNMLEISIFFSVLVGLYRLFNK